MGLGFVSKIKMGNKMERKECEWVMERNGCEK